MIQLGKRTKTYFNTRTRSRAGAGDVVFEDHLEKVCMGYSFKSAESINYQVLPLCLCSYQNPNLCIQMILDMGVVRRLAGLSYTKSEHHLMLTEKHPTCQDNTTPTRILF